MFMFISLPRFDLEFGVKTTEQVADELDLVLVPLLYKLRLLLPLGLVDCISLLCLGHPQGIHGVELVELRLLLSYGIEQLGLLLVLEMLEMLKFYLFDVNDLLSVDLRVKLRAL